MTAKYFNEVCRALGIPCRSVTNFKSAHDTDASLTIDKFINTRDDHSVSKDCIWNFHVWNDVWMDRPDLTKGYGGWQCIDGTPQETSDSKFFTYRTAWRYSVDSSRWLYTIHIAAVHVHSYIYRKTKGQW